MGLDLKRVHVNASLIPFAFSPPENSALPCGFIPIINTEGTEVGDHVHPRLCSLCFLCVFCKVKTFHRAPRRSSTQTVIGQVRFRAFSYCKAEVYIGSEEVVGRAIEGRRDDMFLVSKVLPKNASYKGTLQACERSLARLGVDALDVYLLHWWSDAYPIEETMRAMGELIDAGKTRFVGVSNLDVEELDAAKSALGRHRLACNQVLYHLQERGIEAEVLSWCKRNGLALVGYSPFGSGDFPSPRSEGGKVLARIAEAAGKTPRQVALAFLARDEGVFLIPKAENVAHVRENAGGAFELDKAHMQAIDEAFPMEPGLRFL